MKRKGFLGGTFDPIHFGHLYIAEEALYGLNLESILFIPSGNPPHKVDRDKTDATLRYELVKMAIRCEKRFEISDYEINSKEISFTYKTIKYLNELEPDTSWYFITGVDCLMELEYWKNVDEIFKRCKLVVFNRLGYDKEEIFKQKHEVEKKYKAEILFLDINPLDISSTEIKKLINDGRSVKHLLPENVCHTISELNLYKGEEH